MEDIQERLKSASDACIKALTGWASQKQSVESRETLLEAVHELRKVAARLEIEMAASERAEMSGRPMPIPAHRSQARRPQHSHQQHNQSHAGGDDSAGNALPDFIQKGTNTMVESAAGDEGSSASPQQAARAPRGQFRRPIRRPATGGSAEE